MKEWIVETDTCAVLVEFLTNAWILVEKEKINWKQEDNFYSLEITHGIAVINHREVREQSCFRLSRRARCELNITTRIRWNCRLQILNLSHVTLRRWLQQVVELKRTSDDKRKMLISKRLINYFSNYGNFSSLWMITFFNEFLLLSRKLLPLSAFCIDGTISVKIS
jgi:hypothetical protein